MSLGTHTPTDHGSERRILGSVIFIALGVLLALMGVGAVQGPDWRSIWSLSPLVLILMGTELLATGHVSWWVFFIALLVVIAIVAIGAVSFFAPVVVSGLG
jgi:hypothetical protein